jgi:Ca-activated chloride channel family protein
MTSYFAPLRAQSAEPLALDMQSLFLSGRILPFGAKLSVTHVFRSSETSPLEVVYCFPLPRDASLVSFQISGEGFSIASRLEPRADADKRYEQALEEGSLAAVTQQNLDGLVNLTVGNLRPGETVSVRLELIAGLSLTDTGLRLRFPFTVAPCYHSRMRVSLNAPGIGTIELPDDVSGGAFLPPFHSGADQLHKIGFDLRIEPAQGVGEIASPSHALRVLLHDRTGVGVKLSPEQDVPNRDLVLDVKRDCGVGQAWSDRVAEGRTHFTVVVPSSIFGPPAGTIRRVVFLLDRSGSMRGAQLTQARAAVECCLAKLSPEDQFGIVVFDNDFERFRDTMLVATPKNVDQACGFLRTIDARGGTELATGVEAATHLLAGSAGEIFVITDGQVSGTTAILARVRKCEIRLFCLGVGSASQDRFLELLARQTGGVCRFVTAAERIDDASSELFAAIGGTVAAEVRIAKANVQPRAAGPVFAGTPFVAFGEIDVQASDIELQWPQASRRVPLNALCAGLDGFIEKLHGAKQIADLEARSEGSDPELQRQVLSLSERYQLASSEMSLLAVVERAGDNPGEMPKTSVVPVGMRRDTQFESYFGSLLYSMSPIPIAARISAFQASYEVVNTPRAARTATSKDLLAILREAKRVVDEHASIRKRKGVSRFMDRLRRMLVSLQGSVESIVQNEAMTNFIDFLYSDMIDFFDTGRLDQDKWTTLKQQLEAAWPESINVAANEPDAKSSAETGHEEIRAGTALKEALERFQKRVNQPGTIFSTDHWLDPKLDQLRKLMSDPITEDQATALSDVLHERRWMRDLVDWLEGSPMSWQVFFILRECLEPDPAVSLSGSSLTAISE